VLGGCCGTNPDYIAALCKMLEGKKHVKTNPDILPAVCSATNTVVIDQPRIIGERINPTGKKLFKEALLNNDMDYILNQAIEQANGGADILDVNVGLPGIDEKAMMIKTVKELQGIVDLPLQIDTTIPEVLEAALRVYNGKPIVNSVNGEEKSLNAVLPLVKKYGAAVVGLTLDEKGISKSADERFAIAKRIMERAMEYGIPKRDIFIDCLTLTASAEQECVMETLRALKRVKEELGLKTVLGVSNISFGLPNRELINHNFLTMALTHGLDLPIINPNVASMTGAVRAYKLLMAIDKDSMEYIAAYNAAKQPDKSDKGAAEKNAGQQVSLEFAVEAGLKSEAGKITEELLKTKDAMDIINTMLIPALDRTGNEFEKGKIFLPQLILAAQAAQAAFDTIKKTMVNTNGTSVSKGTVVIATVKGDIHDIGKNIVKVLLENYGYHVVDLGKDVDYQAVVDAVKEHDAKLVGLSALMTTTLVSMDKTIRLIRENGLDCRVMVGGAVLTPEYAKQIGADFYVKDAKESIDVAKRVLNA
ncbi:MAG: dihydropteroate synthase, partial [Alistipes sp.]|nr:dihydropteroate synthase [Alistipes sp.]